MKRIVMMALVLAGAAVLAGCPKKPTVVQPPGASSQVPASAGSSSGAGSAGTTVTPLGGGATSAGGAMGGDNAGPLSKQVIYFDFDKSEIKPEFMDVVGAAAHNLTSNAGLKIRLEGNTDERGTREYNIGLGERRAQAVRRALLLQGVAESQVNTVSFGAERPAVEGDDESAWSKNRRVELVYQPAVAQP